MTSPSPPKRIVWIPTKIHPESFKLAQEKFDVIPGWTDDPRAAYWWDLAEASVVRTGRITEEELKKATELKIITRNGVGYDNVPAASCKERGIIVTNLPGQNASSVAEIALSLGVSVSRRIVELDRRLRRGERLPNIEWLARGLDGKTLGLVGMGNIAYHTAKKFWGAFDTPILVYSPTSHPDAWTSRDPSGRPPIPYTRVASLDELLQRSDVVSLHCPANAETIGMIGERELKLMKPTAILINTARGSLIKEDELVAALKSNVIYGAGLDVLRSEPATREVYHELFALENVVVLPHAGAGTEEVQKEGCDHAVNMVERFFNGEEVFYRVV